MKKIINKVEGITYHKTINKMNWIYTYIVMLISTCGYSQLTGTSLQGATPDVECLLLETMFQEEAFYQLPSLNLKFADTITILDKSRFFDHCGQDAIKDKVLIIKTRDLVPFPLVSGWNAIPEYRSRYKNYFIIEKPEIKGNLIIVTFFKVLSNHNGFFAYKVTKDGLELIDYQIGQY